MKYGVPNVDVRVLPTKIYICSLVRTNQVVSTMNNAKCAALSCFDQGLDVTEMTRAHADFSGGRV